MTAQELHQALSNVEPDAEVFLKIGSQHVAIDEIEAPDQDGDVILMV